MNKKINQLLLDIDVKRLEAIESNRYSLFNSKKFTSILNKMIKDKNYKNLDYIYEIFQDIDSSCAIPLELGNYIEELINDSNFTIGIHRTAILEPLYESKIVKNIMEKGLINNGHAMQGIISNPSIDLTVSVFESMVDAMPMLRGSYKGSTGSFLVVIPSSICDKEHENKEELYNEENGLLYIKPEYIIGYINNGNNMELITRSDYLNHISSKIK